MNEQISFPGLGLSFEIDRVAFTVGDRPVYWYGILIAVAFLAAAVYMMLRVKEFGLDSDRVMDVVLGAVVLGIVGARLYYVAFSWDTYAGDPLSILYIWRGGIAIYGGIIGGVIAAVFMCRWRRVKLLPMLDLATGGLLLGQAVGRWGNFINVEAFGSNTTAKWGMTSPSISWYLRQHESELAKIGVTVYPDQPVHPTFFYESVWCLLGFLLLAWYTKRRRYDGELTLLYLGWYGLGRFFIEGLRTDSLLLGSIRVSQIVALLCVLVSLTTMAVVRSRIRRANDPDYLPLYVNTDEGRAIVAGEFYNKKPDETAKADTTAPAAPAVEETPGTQPTPSAEPQTDSETPQDAPVEQTNEAQTADADREDTENGRAH